MAGSLARRASKLLRDLSQLGRVVASDQASLQLPLSKVALSSTSTGSGPVRPSVLGLLSAAGGLSALGYIEYRHPAIIRAEAAPIEQVAAVDPYKKVRVRSSLPQEIILYQYEVCPFCNKVRAFLDYYKVPYRTVEVNPLSKKELKWSSYKKVPVVLVDGEAVNDSSAIMSSLAADLEAPAEPAASKSHGWFSKPGPAAQSSDPAQAEQEEERWRRWVDQTLVRVITVNIYRNMRESWQTFNYIAEQGNFSYAERQAARVVGASMMWGIGGRLVKKYGIEGDLREALYAAADEWINAVATRQFLGGERPNLADLSVFGVIRSITGTDTFMDLMHKTRIGPWYERMMAAVGPSSRLPS